MATINYIMKTSHTGGDFVNNCHVNALQQQGWQASAMLIANRKRRVRHQWLQPLMTRANLDDVFVISEGDSDLYAELGHRRRIVQHNQAPYYTFGPWQNADAINASPIEAIITPSHHARDVLRTNGVTKSIHVVRPFVDPIFKTSADKDRIIAYNPHKRSADSQFIIGSLRSRHPQLASVQWVPLTGMDRAGVAKVLSKALVYASFAELESLGLLSLEAMRSGCMVVGYKGQGGSEYATEQNGLWVRDGDVQAFVDTLALALSPGNEHIMASCVREGVASAQAFSSERFTRELLIAWGNILGGSAKQFQHSQPLR